MREGEEVPMRGERPSPLPLGRFPLPFIDFPRTLLSLPHASTHPPTQHTLSHHTQPLYRSLEVGDGFGSGSLSLSLSLSHTHTHTHTHTQPLYRSLEVGDGFVVGGDHGDRVRGGDEEMGPQDHVAVSVTIRGGTCGGREGKEKGKKAGA